MRIFCVYVWGVPYVPTEPLSRKSFQAFVLSDMGHILTFFLLDTHRSPLVQPAGAKCGGTHAVDAPPPPRPPSYFLLFRYPSLIKYSVTDSQQLVVDNAFVVKATLETTGDPVIVPPRCEYGLLTATAPSVFACWWWICGGGDSSSTT